MAAGNRSFRLSLAVAATLASLGESHSARADDFATISARVTAQLLDDTASASTVNSYVSSLQADGHWTDITYSSTAATNWSPLTHVQRMQQMSTAYANPASSLYHSAAVASALRSAMDYWFTFTANATAAPSSAQNYGNPTPYSTNWFDNNIAGPQAMGAALALAPSIFTTTEMNLAQNYLANSRKSIPSYSGQNIVDLSIPGIYAAMASGSTSGMTSAFNSMNGTVFVSNFGTDGIQADHTYHIHDVQLYMGGYGSSYINDMTQWAAVSAGTGYQLSDTQLHTLVDYLLDGTQWFIRGQTLDLAADGRQVTFPSYVGAGDGYIGAIQDALSLGSYRSAELQAFLARQQATNSSGVASSGSNNLNGNRSFFNSDAMVQQRPGYYASVKVTSTRTSNPETGNAQGLKNLYLGDGVNQIMVTGNEYLGIQPAWNWYRLPGTTVEQDGRSLTPTGTWGTVHGTTPYAGGVSDGKYGAEAFDYNRYDVKAKKSWFFFDNEEVALGTNINTTSTAYDTYTSINQCLLSSGVSYKTTDSSTAFSLAANSTVTPTNLKWVYQGGVGYFFINPISNAVISNASQTGSWSTLNTAASGTVTTNVFSLYINHGKAVSNATYGYIAVPGISLGQMDSYLTSNISVLNNDATVQAVRQNTLSLTQAAFYSAGSFSLGGGATLAASTSSAAMMQAQNNTLKLTAASPTASQKSVNLTLANLNLSGGSTWFDAFGSGTATFALPGGNLAGSSVGLTLSNNAAANPTVALSSNDGISNSSYTVGAPVALASNTTFSQDAHTSLSLPISVSGTAAIFEAGAGTLILSGPNTFTNGLTLQSGTVRATSASALGTGTSTINGGDLIIGGNLTAAVTLAGGSMNFSGTPTLAGTLTAAPGTSSVIQTSDPSSPGTSVNASFTGTLRGSGTIVIADATGVTSPDASQAFRINSTTASDFTGTIKFANNVKGELFGQTTGATMPAGTGRIILTAGNAALDGTTNATSTTGGYSELNLRNNTAGNQVYGNDVAIVGSGLTLINPLGTAAAGASVTLGNLQIASGQTLGTYLSATYANHPVIFQSVTLGGGIATFAPKASGFGAAGSTGADLSLGAISESVAGSGIAMTGLRTLSLTGDNHYTGPTNVSAGTLVFASGSSSIGSVSGTAPVIVSGDASVATDAITLTSLTIGGSVQVRTNGSSTSKINTLALAGSSGNWSGGLDVTNNNLIVEDATTHAATLATLRDQNYFGQSHAAGLFSSELPANKTLAVLDNASLNLSSFGGVAADAGSILIGPEILGDANVDGKVDVVDLGLLASHWQQSGDWLTGDFNADGKIDVVDLGVLASHWQLGAIEPNHQSFEQALQAVGFGTTVPEPGGLTTLLTGSCFLRRRRRSANTRRRPGGHR